MFKPVHDPFTAVERFDFVAPEPFVCHMANETTTTTLDDYTNATLVESTVILALSERGGSAVRNCREFNLIGKPTLAAKIPTETSWWGSANDHGVGADTEFDATQATSLSNTAASSGSVTITPTEYGVAAALTDNVVEDSVPIDVIDQITSRMLHVLGLAMDIDYFAGLANLSNTVGSTGVDLTLAQAIAAQQGLRVRGVEADALMYILDNEQVLNLDTAFITTNAAAAVFALSADRMIGYSPTADHGMGASRQVMTLRGAPVISTGLGPTANAAADVVGACICPSTAFNDASGATTHGIAWKRLPRFETQRQAKLRATDMVMTARAGFGELQDGAGTAIITDAP
jgi:hypothetical protein